MQLLDRAARGFSITVLGLLCDQLGAGTVFLVHADGTELRWVESLRSVRQGNADQPGREAILIFALGVTMYCSTQVVIQVIVT